MASFTLKDTRYPDGTEVGAYLATPFTAFPANGRPPGTAVKTATASNQEVTFTGLAAETRYFAAAEVDGRFVPYTFTTAELSEPEAWQSAVSDEQTAREAAVEALEEADSTASAEIAVLKEAPLNVKSSEYGAVGDGTTDDTAALLAAAAAWEVSGGVLRMPRGTYKVSQSEIFKLTRPDQSIEGDGQGATFLVPTSAVSGPLITWACLPASDQPAGSVSDLTINGESAAENAVGIKLGDIVGHSLRNVTVRKFTKTGQIGIQARNVAYWTEEFNWANVTLDNNKTGLEFSRAEAGSTSFGYDTISGLRLNAFPGQCGVRFKDDVKLYNTFFRVTGNLHGACVGIELAGTSQVWGLFAVGLETNEAGAVPVKIASGAVLKGTGYLHTSTGEGICENAGTDNFIFNGYLRATGIKTASDLFRVTGPVKNLKPPSEVTAKEIGELLEEVGLGQ